MGVHCVDFQLLKEACLISSFSLSRSPVVICINGGASDQMILNEQCSLFALLFFLESGLLSFVFVSICSILSFSLHAVFVTIKGHLQAVKVILFFTFHLDAHIFKETIHDRTECEVDCLNKSFKLPFDAVEALNDSILLDHII